MDAIVMLGCTHFINNTYPQIYRYFKMAWACVMRHESMLKKSSELWYERPMWDNQGFSWALGQVT
jgi:hypothetical protein